MLRPTAFGLKAIAFYAVVCTAYFASPYTNLFYLLVAFLTILLGLNIWWTANNVRGIEAHVDDVNAITADATHECEVQVDVGTRPRLRVQVELQIGRSHHVLCHLSILDAGESKLRGKLPRLHRGIHELTACRVTSTYPLGLVHAAKRVTGPKLLVVYPAPLPEQLLDLGGAVAGRDQAAATLATSASNETASLREYRDGDPTRHVHWRASARNPRGLIVREFEPCADAAVEVCFDARGEEGFERSLSAIVRLALTAVELDQPIVVHSQELSQSFGAGREPILELWKWLAIASPLPLDAPPPPKPEAHDAVHLPAALHRLGQGAPR